MNISHSLNDYLNNISPENYRHVNGEDRALTYIIINTFVHTIIRWTYGKEILMSVNEIQKEKKISIVVEEKPKETFILES